MKVSVKQQPEEFKPLKLEITLESRDEYDMMYDFFGYNQATTKVIYGDGLKQLKCAELVGSIFDKLKSIQDETE